MPSLIWEGILFDKNLSIFFKKVFTFFFLWCMIGPNRVEALA